MTFLYQIFLVYSNQPGAGNIPAPWLKVKKEDKNLQKLTTFENIFNQLIVNFKEKKIMSQLQQKGINFSNFTLKADKIEIKPLSDDNLVSYWQNRFSHKYSNAKIGQIIVSENSATAVNKNITIPFILGFNTMEAYFQKTSVLISSLGFNYFLQQVSLSQSRGA